MKKINYISLLIAGLVLAGLYSCSPPAPKEKKGMPVKNNFIILLDLSDRIIVQPNQTERDKEIIRHIYTLFEENVKRNLYIRSRDEIKVAIAPQRGVNLPTETYEDRLYVNIENINAVLRKPKEKERREKFFSNLDTLYREAMFSSDPADYYGADIWQYFYEDLRYDYVDDTLTANYLFILTDGYPIVGKNVNKLKPVNASFPGLHTVIVEAAPREKELEWDRIMDRWSEWFTEIDVPHFTIVKRQAISKEKELIEDIVDVEKNGLKVAQTAESE